MERLDLSREEGRKREWERGEGREKGEERGGRGRERGYPENEGVKQGQGAEVFKYFIKGSPPKDILCVCIF